MSKRDNKRYLEGSRSGKPVRSGKNRRDRNSASEASTSRRRGGSDYKKSNSSDYKRTGGTDYKKPSRGFERNTRASQVAVEETSFYDEAGLDVIAGRNPVIEALKGDRDVERIFIAKGAVGSIAQIVAIAKEQGVIVDTVDRERIDAMAPGAKHQGVVAKVSPYKYAELQEVLENARAKGEDPFLILLDELEDPHNLGAIIRSAEGAGAHGVVIPKRRACSLTPVVALSAAGAIETMPVVQVTNLSRTIEELQAEGLWIAAVDMDGKTYYKQDMSGPIGIVIGNEGKGISRNVKSKCDFVISLPMRGQINSLNASNAAAVVMYAIRRARDEKAE